MFVVKILEPNLLITAAIELGLTPSVRQILPINLNGNISICRPIALTNLVIDEQMLHQNALHKPILHLNITVLAQDKSTLHQNTEALNLQVMSKIADKQPPLRIIIRNKKMTLAGTLSLAITTQLLHARTKTIRLLETTVTHSLLELTPTLILPEIVHQLLHAQTKTTRHRVTTVTLNLLAPILILSLPETARQLLHHHVQAIVIHHQEAIHLDQITLLAQAGAIHHQAIIHLVQITLTAPAEAPIHLPAQAVLHQDQTITPLPVVVEDRAHYHNKINFL